jgi:RND family efflux transporter MFP subunit
MRFAVPLLVVLAGTLPAGCARKAPPVSMVRPVQTTVVRYGAMGEPVSLSGQIQAQNQTNLAFRIGGRLIERRVSLGDAVTPGELVARIEAQDEKNTLAQAQATLSAAQAALVQNRNTEERYRKLIASGVIARAQYDDAQAQLAAAQSQVTSATAAVSNARDNLSYTDLYSNVAGSVTLTGAETGEVVQAGQMVIQVAPKGGKDAVFNVPAVLVREAPHNPQVTIALADDPSIKAMGHVREVSPQADPSTGTYLVKVALDHPPDTMRLGATVIGSITLTSVPVMRVPGTALIRVGGAPAVWVVDKATNIVNARAVGVVRYDADSAVLSSGLKDGDIVVTAGVHALRPGQQVRLLSPAG